MTSLILCLSQCGLEIVFCHFRININVASAMLFQKKQSHHSHICLVKYCSFSRKGSHVTQAMFRISVCVSMIKQPNGIAHDHLISSVVLCGLHWGSSCLDLVTEGYYVEADCRPAQQMLDPS